MIEFGTWIKAVRSSETSGETKYITRCKIPVGDHHLNNNRHEDQEAGNTWRLSIAVRRPQTLNTKYMNAHSEMCLYLCGL